MTFTVSLPVYLTVRHRLPQDGARADRATVEHEHRWRVRPYWPSDEGASADLDALRDRLYAFARAHDGTDLNVLHPAPTTEWFASLALVALGASAVEVEDEEGRRVTCTR